MEKNFITILLSVVIVAICFVGAKCTSDYKEEIGRLEDNIEQLQKDSSNVISLTAKGNKEMDVLLDKSMKDAVEKMGVKTSKVRYITSTTTKTKFDTILKLDTMYSVRHDTVAQCFNYIDKHISVGGEVLNGNIDFDLQLVDTLTLVCHKKKKKFLFIPYYSRKELETEITNTNPYSKLVYKKEIKVE